MDEMATSHTRAETRRKITLIIGSIWIQRGLKAGLSRGLRHAPLAANDGVSQKGAILDWKLMSPSCQVQVKAGLQGTGQIGESDTGDAAAAVLSSEFGNLPWRKVTDGLGRSYVAEKRGVLFLLID